MHTSRNVIWYFSCGEWESKMTIAGRYWYIIPSDLRFTTQTAPSGWKLGYN